MTLSRPLLTFDPRSKLVTIFLASLLLMFRVEWEVEVIFILLMFVLLAVNGGIKIGLIFSGLYFATLILELLLLKEINGPISAFFSFLLVATRLLIPPIMAASFAMNQTKMSEWIAAMKKMKVPLFIIVPFSVVCRFFPVLIRDFKQIRQIMKFRGIGINSSDLFKHPILTLEYILVPLLVSVENTSVDLSAAALVRGLGNEAKHSSVHNIKFQIQDYILLLILGVFFCMEVFFL